MNPETKTESAQRLQALWYQLDKRNLDGFLVPSNDEYQGEYVPPSAQRLTWLTGFTGSAGLAIVHRQGCAIFVDGRYILAVYDQVDTSLFQPFNIKDCSPAQWLSQQSSARLGYDPWLHTPDNLDSLQQACETADIQLVPTEVNLIDTIWLDKPALQLAPIVPHLLEYSGETSHSKREAITKQLAENKIDAVVLTVPDSIAWLLNIRGGDVPHAPLPHCFAILQVNESVDLFVDSRKVSPGLIEHLTTWVTFYEPSQLGERLGQFSEKTVQVDPKQVASWIVNRLKTVNAKIKEKTDPCLLPKACKNAVEIAGARAAHQRDGVALTRFLFWLSQHAQTGEVDEIQAAEYLAKCRADTGQLQDLSFATISAAGAHGAIVHYQVTPQTNHPLLPGTLYLVDSGGQYLDGTTDVTRTIAICSPTAEHQDRFTRVLKGHIQLATCRFPANTTGTQLDALARQALWQAGFDYDHGTGHGVGSYLSVHEGPQSFSKRVSSQALKPGMIVSNEPGYYQKEAYGIRIENLMVVTPPQAIEGGEIAMMGFEILTQAPIDLSLINPILLTPTEKTWLNNYHQTVFNTIAPYLEPQVQQWLEQATRLI
jgi:Xaa-Pro aminopeptidase